MTWSSFEKTFQTKWRNKLAQIRIIEKFSLFSKRNRLTNEKKHKLGVEEFTEANIII